MAVAAAGHRRVGGGAHRGPSHAFFDYLFSAVLVGITVAAISIVYVLWRERDALIEGVRPQQRQRRLYGALVGLLVILLLSVFAHRAGLRLPHPFGAGGKVHHTVTGPAAPHRHATRPAATEPTAHFRWLPAALVGAFFLALTGIAAYNAARRRVRREDELEAAEEIAAVLDTTIDDLRAELDPRRAIIAAYARMEHALGSFGLARHPAEAPLEYLARALAGLRASGASVRRLTDLFRLAKFSDHALGPADKEDAIAALVAVRAELRSEA